MFQKSRTVTCAPEPACTKPNVRQRLSASRSGGLRIDRCRTECRYHECFHERNTQLTRRDAANAMRGRRSVATWPSAVGPRRSRRSAPAPFGPGGGIVHTIRIRGSTRWRCARPRAGWPAADRAAWTGPISGGRVSRTCQQGIVKNVTYRNNSVFPVAGLPQEELSTPWQHDAPTMNTASPHGRNRVERRRRVRVTSSIMLAVSRMRPARAPVPQCSPSDSTGRNRGPAVRNTDSRPVGRAGAVDSAMAFLRARGGDRVVCAAPVLDRGSRRCDREPRRPHRPAEPPRWRAPPRCTGNAGDGGYTRPRQQIVDAIVCATWKPVRAGGGSNMRPDRCDAKDGQPIRPK